MPAKSSSSTPSRTVISTFRRPSGRTSPMRLKTSSPSSSSRMPVNVFRPKWFLLTPGCDSGDPPGSWSLHRTSKGTEKRKENYSNSRNLLTNIFEFYRNNSARELSAFAESAIAVNRVVIQHMSINLTEEHPDDTDPESNKENCNNTTTEVIITDSTVASNKLAEKRKAPPFGLSPPSESKLIQRRKQSQSLNFNSCRNTSRSNVTKNSSNYLVPTSNIVESPGC